MDEIKEISPQDFAALDYSKVTLLDLREPDQLLLGLFLHFFFLKLVRMAALYPIPVRGAHLGLIGVQAEPQNLKGVHGAHLHFSS